MGKKVKNSLTRDEKKTLVQNILGVYLGNPHSAFNYKQISARLGYQDRASKDLIRLLVEDLFLSKELVMSKRGKYQVNPESESNHKDQKTVITGTVDMKGSGKAYVIPEDRSGDIFVAPENTHHALNGDLVKVFLLPLRKGHKKEGEITEIVKRSKSQFVGVVEVSKNFAFLIPDNPSMPVDIHIPTQELNGARNGDKCIAVITEWPDHSNNPFGKIVTVLGKPGDNKEIGRASCRERVYRLV
jgi:ribonuclease R